MGRAVESVARWHDLFSRSAGWKTAKVACAREGRSNRATVATSRVCALSLCVKLHWTGRPRSGPACPHQPFNCLPRLLLLYCTHMHRMTTAHCYRDCAAAV